MWADCGFNLVDLAVAVVVLGIFVLVLIPVIAEVQFAARRANAESVAANAAQLVTTELVTHDSADTTHGELAAQLDTLRAAFESKIEGATLNVDPAEVEWEYCVTATVPGFGVATRGPGCTAQGWQDE